MTEKTLSPIDAVIAWVDGNDPAHAEKRRRYAAEDGVRHKTSQAATRFDSQGEIYVCVASILKFLPFIRTIWIVTDGQRPPFIDNFATSGHCSADKIRIVDHRDILGDHPEALPTFNSLTIEAALWRIPGLADRHIYFNDDMFVKSSLLPSYFFDEDGHPKVRGRILSMRSTGGIDWLKHDLLRKLRPNHWGRASFRTAQENGALAVRNQRTFIHQEHWPHPMRTTTLARYYEENPEEFAKQVRPRFRVREQHWPISLHNHLTTVTAYEPPRVAYAKPGRHVDTMLSQLLAEGYDFGCMQSLDEIDPDKTARLFSGLVDIYQPYLDMRMLGAGA